MNCREKEEDMKEDPKSGFELEKPRRKGRNAEEIEGLVSYG